MAKLWTFKINNMNKPNIVVILSDDQGVWASGCYGNTEINTPNIDRIAKKGLRFDNFFVATPVCSPSRATFLTGMIPSQHGIHDWISGGNTGKTAIEYLKDTVTYTDILSRNGWSCGISGKWHLGNSQVPQHGFSDWYVHQAGGGQYYNAPMIKNGKLVNQPGYVTDAITDEAIKLLEKYSKTTSPFYLSVHYTAPHSPWINHHPKEIVDYYDDCKFESCPQESRHPWAVWLTDENLGNKESLKGYFAAVTAMDKGIGSILNKLDYLGLTNDTLVIFTSDNGFSCGHHGFWGKGNGTNPRNMYENSIKVPAIFSQPGTIPSGKVETEFVSAYDFFPTIIDYANIEKDYDVNLPGTSFKEALLNRNYKGKDDIVIFDEYGPVRMIRTKEWKYVHRHPKGPNELYNLVNDYQERNNLANIKKYNLLITELKSKMEKWFAQYVYPSKDGINQDSKLDGQDNLIR